MSSFSEFSKHADHHDEEPGNKKKQKVDDIAKNRIDPETGNEREDREPIGSSQTRNMHEANDNPNMRTSERSQDRNQQTSRL